ncbi:MAG TPA: hypothetical protein VG817_00425, partial [Gemmatimonadales bacterium]|nr:hypothetical protein [Gemmatimonadales bacterium]
ELMPKGLQPVSAADVNGWVSRTTPKVGALHRFTWLYEEEGPAKGGRGSTRIALPDSLRFDIAGSLGIGKGAAFVVGESKVWVQPEKAVEDLVPSYPLLWSLVGIALAPAPDAKLTGLQLEGRVAWQYASGPDTVSYLRTDGNPSTLSAEVRRAGKVIGRTTTTVRPDGSPVKSQLLVPSVPAKLTVTYYANVPTSSFPPDTWVRPEP